MNFQELEGDYAIIYERGVFKDVPLYQRGGMLFAKHKGGYIRVNKDGSTSSSSVSLKELVTDADLFYDSFGRLSVQGTDKNKPLAPEQKTLLIGEN